MLKINNKYTLGTIDHMTHINNLKSILDNGLMAHNNPHKTTDISNLEVNDRRSKLEPVNHKPIHEYVPFYFNPRNAMLYRNQMKYGEAIIILGFDPKIIQTKDAIFTDCNAACNDTSYFDSINDFPSLNWDNIFSDSWYDDQSLKQTMMAETLVPRKVSINNLQCIFCKTERVKQFIVENYELHNVQAVVADDLFFENVG